MVRSNSGLELQRFDYSRVGEHCAVLRVLARLTGDLRAPESARLVVELGPSRALPFPARASRSERWVIAYGESELLWRALFAVPFAVVEQPQSFFELTAAGNVVMALPAPSLRTGFDTLRLSPALAEDVARFAPAGFRRAAALATAVAVTASSTPALALATGTGTTSHLQATQQHIAHLAAEASDSARAEAAVRSERTASSRRAGRSQAPSRSSAASRAKAPSGQKGASGKNAASGKKGASVIGLSRPAVTHIFSAPKRRPASKPGQTNCTTSAASVTGTPLNPRGETAAQRRAQLSAQAGLICPPTRTHKRDGTAGKGSGGGTVTGTGTGTGSGTGTATGTGTGTHTGPGAPSPIPTPGTGNTAPTPTGGSHEQSSSRHPAPVRGTGRTGSGGVSLGGLSRRPPVKLPRTSRTGSGGAAPTLEPSPPGFLGPKSWTGTVSTDPAISGALGNLSSLLENGDRPPRFLIPIYMEAGKLYNVPWEVLAGINAVETDYGRDLSTSSAGAIGWMQFEPSTWREWGVAADGHSVPNPYDPRDAIFSAARYLAAAGAAQDISRAIYAYNHAGWYVTMVLTRAKAIAANIRPERQSIKGRVISVYFATTRPKHPTVRFRGGLLTHYDRLIASANMVSAANFPYVYGGGHEQPARFGPFDCSGSVSYVMQQAGYKVQTTVSGDIPSWKFPAGPGRVTIFYNPTHTFMRIGNRYFGTSGFARPGGGAGWFDADKLPENYLAQFREVHVPHLGTDSFAAPKHSLHRS